VELLLTEVEADEVATVAPCSEGERSHRRRKGRGAAEEEGKGCRRRRGSGGGSGRVGEQEGRACAAG